MLVCNVSLRPRRSAIAADVAEITAAVDALATGNVVFATLVDDPASVAELVDAYLGEIMLEAANAVDTVSLASIYEVAVSETVTAADSSDAAKGAVTIWNASDATNIVLTNSNLTAAASANAQASVRGTTSKTSGKYYFEVTCSGTLQNSAVGISTSSPGGSTLVPTLSAFINVANSVVFINGANTGSSGGGGAFVTGDVACIAVDFINQRIWFRHNNAFWNNDLPADPATNTNGLDISAIFASAAAFPIVTFNGTGLNHTGNFGGSAFAQTVPSGFSAWG